jgi:two-component system sensor histidine kinase BaeS
MKRPRHRLRTRLMVAMLAIALGVLLLTAGVTASLARRTSANAARSDLEQQAPEVANALDAVFAGVRKLTPAQLRQRLQGATLTGPRIKTLIETTLKVSNGAVIAFDANGDQQEILGRLFGNESSLITLPPGVSASDLDTQKLLAGDTDSGRSGNTEFVAVPLGKVQDLTPVVVLAKNIETRPFGQSSGVVLLAAIVAIVVAALVAAYLARRMTRPIAAMETTAGRIAAGDLSARVDVEHVPHDELGELATAINTMGEELQSAQGHERAFLLSVSHDLRTPLTSIRGYAQAIADGTIVEAEDQLRAAEVISSEARRLQRLVADLLDLARLDAHQFSLTPRSIEATEVVGETVAAFQPQATDLGLGLAFRADGAVPLVADPERLGQIVANLVENALKFASTEVTVSLGLVGGSATLTVDDDGPGINPADLPHVFERLYTSRTVPGRAVGTGIGLAIVHELAVAMGGNARVEPVGTTGTRFVVTVPAIALAPPAAAPAPG